MRHYIFSLIFILAFVVACKESDPNITETIARDTSVTSRNAFTEIFFDSAALQHFFSSNNTGDTLIKRMRNFYNSRNYQYAWFFNDGIADYASTFLQMQNDYIAYSGDTSLDNTALHEMVDSLNEIHRAPNFSDSDILKTELMLTSQFFRYAHRAYQGRSGINAKELDWFIPRKKIDATVMLDSLITNKGKNVEQYEPVNKQYNLLKSFLLKYYAIKNNGDWAKISFEKKSYKRGDSSLAIAQMKRRLIDEGDLIGTDTSTVFDSAMQTAVKNFQHRYGFKEDGVAGVAVLTEMNRSVDDYIRKILINMERMKWVPAQPEGDFLLVNIPEFRLHAYENGKHAWSMNVVVGTAAHNTVIFTGNLKYIVFSPYWNVPSSILRNEILPAIRRNKNYLAAHNMEWNGNSVRQKPGPSNSLGLVKFLFPNDYNIYLHDTPTKNLFNENKRAFSHGCIRLAEPKKLAEFLLRDDKSWNTDKITKAMNAGKEQYVTLKNPVPVFIGYFTAWVNSEGQLTFRDDIYGHDQRMAEHLFTNTALK